MARESKGSRQRTSVVFPPDAITAAREHARDLGFDGMSDLLQHLLAQELGRQDLEPRHRLRQHVHGQGRLRMSA